MKTALAEALQGQLWTQKVWVETELTRLGSRGFPKPTSLSPILGEHAAAMSEVAWGPRSHLVSWEAPREKRAHQNAASLCRRPEWTVAPPTPELSRARGEAGAIPAHHGECLLRIGSLHPSGETKEGQVPGAGSKSADILRRAPAACG